MCVVFLCKQKTAYEMRISDWSSDVCSSDLDDNRVLYSAPKAKRDEVTWCRGDDSPRAAEPVIADMIDAIAGEVRRDITPHMQDFHIRFREGQIGRASCRERVCQYV